MSLAELDLHLGERAAELGFDHAAIAFLGIGRLKGIGYQALFRLGGREGIRRLVNQEDASALVRHLMSGRTSISPNEPGDWKAIYHQILASGIEQARELADRRVRIIFEDDPYFPMAFTRIPPMYRPRWLFVRGNFKLLDKALVAIVGTREPTETGKFLTQYAVCAARELESPVVSGLARGVDCIAHEWCVRLSLPTISILGTGILRPYPAGHANLSNSIVDSGGALVSEYLPHQGPSARQFVWRNRIQAALSCALVPTEWYEKSGTAHTVRFARLFQRPVIGLNVAYDRSIADNPGKPDLSLEVPKGHSRFLEVLTSALNTQLPDTSLHRSSHAEELP